MYETEVIVLPTEFVINLISASSIFGGVLKLIFEELSSVEKLLLERWEEFMLWKKV